MVDFERQDYSASRFAIFLTLLTPLAQAPAALIALLRRADRSASTTSIRGNLIGRRIHVQPP
ncbi:hypothetical protein [Mesorhizobium amorphae]|uniref:hypothetical protein n=1 Tax=Mesorhizobium amorphae TaxID=71433 RepID=UPI00177B6B68|nr:hypothetical protein [Mesorhizobium amorphae]